MKDLQLDKLYVLTPTNDRFPLKENIEVIGLKDILKVLLA
jgi:hypothetical protein